ncbi:MAG: phosphatase PAP2 family protein [Pseudomonadota bacterium]
MQPRQITQPIVAVEWWGSATWIVIWVVLGIDLCWLLVAGWTVAWRDVGVVAAVVAGGYALLSIGRYRSDLRIRITVTATTQLVMFTAVAGTLSYLVISTCAPLIDAPLAALDQALGFDWLALAAWLRVNPTTAAVLRLAYYSGLVQMAVVVLFLGLTARQTALDEFVRLFIAATLFTIAISGALPAAGAWKHYGLSAGYDLASLAHFEPLRNGQLRHVSLGGMQGLISIPSMHAAAAVLFVHAVRESRPALSIFIVLNTALLVATPVDGSHYLVDVLAGAALAVGLIVFERRRRSRPVASGQRRPSAVLGALQR